MSAQSPERREYDVGVQSFTYREFDVPEMCDELADTGVSAVELCHEHVRPSASEDDVDAVRERLAGAGLDVCGYGVVAFGEDGPPVRETLALVDRLGGDYCSLEFLPDDTATRDRLLSEAANFDLQLAVHNHGPGATYETVEDVVAVLDAAGDPRLGACVDTGHYFRSGQDPETVLSELGDRVLALHLKDFLDEDTEAVPGEGQLDVPALIETLAAETSLSQPLVVEYEADPDDPTPAVTRAAETVRDALQ